MLGYPSADPTPAPAGIEPELAGLAWYRIEINLIEGTRPFGASGPFGPDHITADCTRRPDGRMRYVAIAAPASSPGVDFHDIQLYGEHFH